MATDKNFIVKNGLEVGGQEVISSSGVVTSAALGGQTLGTTDSPTFANTTLTGSLRGPATFTIDPAAVGDNTGTLVIAGNLQVDGTTTTINSTTMEVDDLNITLASGAANAAAANGAGITVDGASATITYDSTNDEWDFNKDINVTGTVTFDGGTTSADLNFGDSDKAIFGAGSALQIYHNGTNSFIDEVGTGRLYIRAENNLTFTNANTTKTYANFENAGAAKFYYNSVLSILTTTAGAEVREGLTVGSSANDLGTTAGNQLTPLTLRSDTANTDSLLFTTERLADGTDWTTAAHRIQRKVDATKMGYIQFGSGGSDLVTFGENATEYMRLDGTGQLGVGVSPSAKFHVKKDGTGQTIALFSSDMGTNDRNFSIRSPASDSASEPFEFSTGNSFQFTIDGGAALNIAADKNIGIGTVSPARPLHISGTTTTQLELEQTSASSDVRMLLDAGGTNGQIQFAGASHASIPNTLSLVSAGDTRFVQAGQTVMHLDSASGGQVIIGGTAAIGSATFTVDSDSAAISVFDSSAASGGYLQFRNNNTPKGLIGFGANAGANSTNDMILSSSSGSIDITIPETAGAAIRLEFGNNDNTTRRTVQAYKDNFEPASADTGVIGLGSPTSKWKDLYLSGTAYVDTAVGIGTSNPSGKIQANAADSQVAVMAGGDVSDPLYPAFGFDGQIGSNGGRGAGMYLPADGTLAWSTAGSERMRIDSSGNLLVGTTSLTPNYTGGIRVHSASNVSNIRVSSGDKTGFDMMQDTGGTGYLVVRDNAGMTFHTNNTERLRIDSSGSLIIGKTDTTNNNTAGIYMLGSGAIVATRSSDIAALFNRTTSDGNIILLRKDNVTTGSIGTSGTSMTFGTGTNGAEKMRISSTGNVGIGTTSPSTELHVYSADQNALTVQTNTGINQIGILNSTNSPTYIAAASYVLQLKADDNGWGGTASAIQFNVKSTERMKIAHDGETTISGTKMNVVSSAEAVMGAQATGHSYWRVVADNSPNTYFQAGTGQTSSQVKMYFTGMFGSNNTMTVDTPNTRVGIATTAPSSTLTVNGSLSKSSGSFRIDHPLEAKSNTHDLVHSFVEAPQADNIYRGKVDLVDGSAAVNIDTVAGMTEGTFVALNREVQCFTTNESNWDAVKGSVSGNILTIESQNSESTATISWLVIGERQDEHMYDTEWTDDNGKVIVEPLK